jgi:hypothetical protein
MERHSIGEVSGVRAAPRPGPHEGNRKLVDIAQAVVDGHALLRKHP